MLRAGTSHTLPRGSSRACGQHLLYPVKLPGLNAAGRTRCACSITIDLRITTLAVSGRLNALPQFFAACCAPRSPWLCRLPDYLIRLYQFVSVMYCIPRLFWFILFVLLMPVLPAPLPPAADPAIAGRVLARAFAPFTYLSVLRNLGFLYYAGRLPRNEQDARHPINLPPSAFATTTTFAFTYRFAPRGFCNLRVRFGIRTTTFRGCALPCRAYAVRATCAYNPEQHDGCSRTGFSPAH